HQAPMRRSGVSQDRGDTDESERPDQRHLDGPVGARARVKRGDAALDEMDVLDRMKMVLQDRPPLQPDRRETRGQLAKAYWIQAGKNLVPDDHDTVRPRTLEP